MKSYIRKMPVEPMRAVVKAAEQARREWLALDPERDRLPKNNIEMDNYIKQHGENGREQLQQARARIWEEENAIKARLSGVVQAQKAAYIAAVDAMFSVSPDNLTGSNAAELQLLQLDLISTPADMRAFVTRNAENPALMQLATRYADKHASGAEDPETGRQWAQIAVEDTTEKALRSFVSWFDTTGRGAATDPDGYSALMCTRPNMELDTMRNYGLLEEYGAATGAAVDPESVYYALSGVKDPEAPADPSGDPAPAAGE